MTNARHLFVQLVGLTLAFCFIAEGAAENTKESLEATAQSETDRMPRLEIELLELASRVSDLPRKVVVVDPSIPARLDTSLLPKGPLKYSVFLTFLRVHTLVASVTDTAVVIMPDASARQEASPIVSNLDAQLPEDQWVTYIARVKHVSAPELVPVLRPLLPQAAHMAAFPDQQALIIVDRLANVRRVVGVIRSLDRQVPQAD